MGLKALLNCSDQFSSNKIPVSLCEGPKPPHFMTYGFLFMDFNIPNDLKKYGKILENIIFENMRINKVKNWEISHMAT